MSHSNVKGNMSKVYVSKNQIELLYDPAIPSCVYIY